MDHPHHRHGDWADHGGDQLAEIGHLQRRAAHRPGAQRAPDSGGGRRTADRDQHRAGHRGQARHSPARHGRSARRGAPAHRGRPRRRQDEVRQGAGPLDRLLGAPRPVHARPAAERRHRRERLQRRGAATSSSSPARSSRTSSSATRSTAPRRRPRRRCSSAWRSGRSPSTASPTARGAVPGARHPEPDRHGGHLPAARGAARPVHRAHLDGLPGPDAPRSRCSASTRPPTRWTALRPVSDATEVRALIDAVRARPRRRGDQGLRGRPRRGDPALGRGAARCVAAGHAAAAAGAKAWAALDGRDYVMPDDLQCCSLPCWPTDCCSPPRPTSPAAPPTTC